VSETERPTRDLEWTGERYIPGIQGDVAVEHLHRSVVDLQLADQLGVRLRLRHLRQLVAVSKNRRRSSPLPLGQTRRHSGRRQ